MFTQLGIDQIRFIIRLKNVNTHTLLHDSNMDAAIYKGVREHIWSCTQDWMKGATHWDTKGAMMKSAYPLPGGSKLTVGLGWSSKPERHFVTVQFNPSKLNADAACELIGTFQCMFENGYAEFIERAECNYIEIPLDIHGAQMDDYLYFDERLHSCNPYYEPDGTLYIGSRTSSRYVTIYNKAKEIVENGGPIYEGAWLRMEPHVRPGTPANAINALSDAFTTLRVIDKEKLTAIKLNISVKAFRDRINNGLQPQQAYRVAPDKKGLLAGLTAVAPDWYDPTAIWEMFPAAAHRITNAGMQAIAGSPHFAPPILPLAAKN